MTVTAYFTKISITTLIREECERRGIVMDQKMNSLQMLDWSFDGEVMNLREAADKFLVGGWDANF